MSSAALDQPPFLYAQPGDAPAPLSYEIATRGAIQPTASTATFDGTGAGGSFLACLSFYAQSGELLSRVFPQTVVAAGDVAQVSYAPFPGGLATSGGIAFNRDNQGGYLDVTTNATDPAGLGLNLLDASGGGATIGATGGGAVRLNSDRGIFAQAGIAGSGDLSLINSGTGVVRLETDGGGDVQILTTAGGNVTMDSSAGDANVTAGGAASLSAQGLATVLGFAGVDVLDVGATGVRIQTTAGQISILTAVGQHGILLGGGYPIILNADTNGATNNTTIQMRLDGSTNSFAVINLAASAVYFAVRSDGRVAMPLLPTSSAGLGAGDLWRSGNDVKIV